VRLADEARVAAEAAAEAERVRLADEARVAAEAAAAAAAAAAAPAPRSEESTVREILTGMNTLRNILDKKRGTYKVDLAKMPVAPTSSPSAGAGAAPPPEPTVEEQIANGYVGHVQRIIDTLTAANTYYWSQVHRDADIDLLNAIKSKYPTSAATVDPLIAEINSIPDLIGGTKTDDEIAAANAANAANAALAVPPPPKPAEPSIRDNRNETFTLNRNGADITLQVGSCILGMAKNGYDVLIKKIVGITADPPTINTVNYINNEWGPVDQQVKLESVMPAKCPPGSVGGISTGGGGRRHADAARRIHEFIKGGGEDVFDEIHRQLKALCGRHSHVEFGDDTVATHQINVTLPDTEEVVSVRFRIENKKGLRRRKTLKASKK
jgi:hypothetical protein